MPAAVLAAKQGGLQTCVFEPEGSGEVTSVLGGTGGPFAVKGAERTP